MRLPWFGRLAAALLVPALLAVAGPARAACPGDCDGDGVVGIAELVTLVGIALDGGGVERCPAGDRDGGGTIDIAELVTAVAAALEGCPAVSTPTAPSATATAPEATGTATTPPASATASSPPTGTPTVPPASPTATASNTPLPGATDTVAPATATATALPSATASASPPATATASATLPPSATATATAPPSASATSTGTATAPPTATPPTRTTATEATATWTVPPSATHTATVLPTATASASVTRTASGTPTASAVPTATATAAASPTVTATPTRTGTATRTPTPTRSGTATRTATRTTTPTRTGTATRTATPSVTPTPSLTVTATATPGLGVRRLSLDPATSRIEFLPDAGSFAGFSGYLDLAAGVPDPVTGLARVAVTGASEFLSIELPGGLMFCFRPIVPVADAGVLSCAAGVDLGVTALQDHVVGVVGEDGFTAADCTAAGGVVEPGGATHPGVCNGPVDVGPAPETDSGAGALLLAPDARFGTHGLPVELSVAPGPCASHAQRSSTVLGLVSSLSRAVIHDANAEPDAVLEHDARGEAFSCQDWRTENGPGRLVLAVPAVHGAGALDLITVYTFDD